MVHGAWTDYSNMRAIVVEFAGTDDSDVVGILEGAGLELPPGTPVSPGEGRLVPQDRPVPHDRSEGEPV